MNYSNVQGQQWLAQVETYLPAFRSILENTPSPILVVGASVCDIFQLQGWIPVFRRRTGDVDLSVGLNSNNADDHQWAKQQLLNHGYRVDTNHPYRFHSPREDLTAISYIDLLADPVGPASSSQQARAAMGVGEGFTLKGFSFARKAGFQLLPRVTFPNPIGFLALKREGYLDEPARRLKDLADIAEVTNGLVETGTHFEIDDIWNQIKNEPEAQDVRRMLADLGSGESVQWDLENVSGELSRRGFTQTDIEDVIPRRLSEFAEALT